MKRPFAIATALMLVAVISAPATGHKDHNKQEIVADQKVEPGLPPTELAAPGIPVEQRQIASATSNAEMERFETPFLIRLADWFGRLHPAIVHFPIAFFPAAFFTAVVGRRRPAFGKPIQFLVIAGGIFAPVAAAAGYISALGAKADAIITYHLWLGVAIGIGGAAIAGWAWKRPWDDRGAGMILALGIMTAAIAVQGFLGAAITHGIEHLMF